MLSVQEYFRHVTARAGTRRAAVTGAVLLAGSVGIAAYALPFRGWSSNDGEDQAQGKTPIIRLKPLSIGRENANGAAAQRWATFSTGRKRVVDTPSVVKSLQTALQQADCYDGPINSVWTRRSQAAMRAFLTTVNAQLPVEQPDEVLLSLIETNDGARCGTTSPEVAVTSEPAPRVTLVSERAESESTAIALPLRRQEPTVPARPSEPDVSSVTNQIATDTVAANDPEPAPVAPIQSAIAQIPVIRAPAFNPPPAVARPVQTAATTPERARLSDRVAPIHDDADVSERSSRDARDNDKNGARPSTSENDNAARVERKTRKLKNTSSARKSYKKTRKNRKARYRKKPNSLFRSIQKAQRSFGKIFKF